jgi:hypothetical protein
MFFKKFIMLYGLTVLIKIDDLILPLKPEGLPYV